MKIETLLERIENTEKKIIKVNGTLERHNKKLEKIKDILLSKGVNIDNYNKYDESYRGDIYWDLCDYEHKLEDISNNDKKLKEAKETLEKLNNLLQVEKKKKNDINNLLPKCVLDYLEVWKFKAKEYLLSIAKEYIELYNKEYDVTEEEMKELYENKYVKDEVSGKSIRKWCRSYEDDEIKTIIENQNKYEIKDIKREINRRYRMNFEERINKSDLYILSKVIEHYEVINTDMIDKILNDDVETKKEMFIDRVSAVVGVIREMKDFEIGDNGEINGIAIGDKTKAKVTTIIAGGYNIQCQHFRVLVNKIK